MSPHRRLRNRHDLRCLTVGPSVAVNKYDRHPLLPTQPTQCGGETGLNPRLSTRHRYWIGARPEPGPALTLTNPIQVADRLVHPTHPVPVFPAIRQCLRCRISTAFGAIRRHQRDPEPRLVELHKIGELILNRSNHSVAPVQSALSPRTTLENATTVTPNLHNSTRAPPRLAR
jgi:hypothetical protein